MKNQATQRQKQELARRKAMPIALIQRPLKHIAERDFEKVIVKGVTTIVMGPTYKAARKFADYGNGLAVKNIAMQMQ